MTSVDLRSDGNQDANYAEEMKFKRSKIEKAVQDINKALMILKSESDDDKLADQAINGFSKPLKHCEDKVKRSIAH